MRLTAAVLALGGCMAVQDRAGVSVEENVVLRGRACAKIVTPSAVWWFDMEGGGFAALEDRDGKDWIGWKAGGRAGGEFRGIPNAVHPEGYFHPGNSLCRTRILERGPGKAVLESESKDGRWLARWEIRPDAAIFRMVRHAAPYWFLYEGTPGGKLDPDEDFCLRSNGERTPASTRWTGDLPGPEWAAFGDGATGRVLFLARRDDDDKVDSYWPMDGLMTVFGFGRDGLKKHLDAPADFAVGFCESADPAAVARAVAAALEAR